MSDLLDGNGYPSEETLDRVANWPAARANELFDFIRPIWAHADSGYWRQDTTKSFHFYYLSTAGWSGNEDLIRALSANPMWQIYWEESKRGGHHTFKVPR